MVGHRSKKQGIAVMGLAFAALCGTPRDADACGACYTSATESTVVNDHKMALKITNQQTVLWDQITYTGNPKEFAYVVPARPGTKLEASNDGFFVALDLTTRPIIMAPQPAYSGSGGDGCSPGCSDTTTTSAYSESAGSPRGETVQVVEQKVVGPYETVTLRSTDPDALQEWLTQHGFAIPETSTPIIASYVSAGFDFIALRLAPGNDVRSMKPIRIVSPTPDAELPLRMMQIGAGAKVGITLYVLAEGRYQPQNFPLATFDKTKLIWDYSQNRSNYQELSLKAMDAENGRAMLVEFANMANMTDTGTAYQPSTGGMGSNPSLPDAYRGACKPEPIPPARMIGDASTDDADAAPEAGAVDAGVEAPEEPPTPECDDLAALIEGINTSDLWITRIRSNLPNAALADTLKLEAAKQEPVENVFQVSETGTITARIARTGTGRAFGSASLVLGTVFFLSRIVRRRRHQSKS
jgi:hypothetical protein